MGSKFNPVLRAENTIEFSSEVFIFILKKEKFFVKQDILNMKVTNVCP